MKTCTKCLSLKRLDMFYKDKYKRDGYRERCKSCDKEVKLEHKVPTIVANRLNLKNQGLKQCSKCNVIKPFSDYHMQSKAKNIPMGACKKCYRTNSPYNEVTSYTIEQCHEVALLYKHRGKFAEGDKNVYMYASRRGWLDKICTHMTPARRGGRGGWRKSEYIDLCSDKKVEPIIYLLKCWDEEESFYKIGITSLSVSKRYHRPENMPYDYEILWELRGDAELIWELEYSIKRATKKHRYRPFVKFDGSTHECFKCHGNCSILKIPKGLKVSP